MKRSGIVDIYRLLFIFLIMAHHLYISSLFANAWIYVEFFFILSGYFTMKHYASGEWKSIEEKTAESITYTFHKFKKVMPYVAAAVLLEYGLDYITAGFQGIRALFSTFENMICELCLLSSSGLINANVAPIWYLSAMFLVFPLFTFMLSFQEMHKWYYGFLSWVPAVLYYGKVGVISRLKTWPYDLPRAFVCLWLGVFVYGISEMIKKRREEGGGNRWVFAIAVTLLEIGSFAFTIVCTGYGIESNILIIFAFLIGSSALLSGCSFTSKIPGIPVIGELSMALYLMHWPVKTMINCFGGNVQHIYGIVLYYVISICLSVFLIFVNRKKNCFTH